MIFYKMSSFKGKNTTFPSPLLKCFSVRRNILKGPVIDKVLSLWVTELGFRCRLPSQQLMSYGKREGRCRENF